MERLLAAVAVLIVGSIGGLSVMSNEGSSRAADPAIGTTAEELQTLNQEHPEAPLLLPVLLPAGYGWAGVGETQGDGQRVWARTSQFTSVSGDPVIELCTKGLQQIEGCEQDDDSVLVRQQNGYRIYISQEGARFDPELRTFWESVPLTTSYAQVRWLDD